uniref:Kazal protease inhibitor like protein n=1 Tax=Rhipicephalus zambeziensis TaxID=60191 RepID=A0A224YDA1_9ACAR
MATTKKLLPYLIIFAVLAMNCYGKSQSPNAGASVEERAHDPCLDADCSGMYCPPPCSCPDFFSRYFLGRKKCVMW